MTAPRFEIVRTDAGFHARFRSSNGNIIMSSEVYARRRGALRAVELITHGEYGLVEIRDVDERQGGAA